MKRSFLKINFFTASEPRGGVEDVRMQTRCAIPRPLQAAGSAVYRPLATLLYRWCRQTISPTAASMAIPITASAKGSRETTPASPNTATGVSSKYANPRQTPHREEQNSEIFSSRKNQRRCSQFSPYAVRQPMTSAVSKAFMRSIWHLCRTTIVSGAGPLTSELET